MVIPPLSTAARYTAGGAKLLVPMSGAGDERASALRAVR
jgi:hypothetical protein